MEWKNCIRKQRFRLGKEKRVTWNMKVDLNGRSLSSIKKKKRKERKYIKSVFKPTALVTNNLIIKIEAT